MLKPVVFTLVMLITHQSASALTIPIIQNPEWQNKLVAEDALAKAGLAEFQDEVMDDEDFELNSKQLHEAKVWELTSEEEKRYLKLMKSRSGLYYQGLRLSPVDVLGLNARSDSERQHFSTLAAKQEAQKVAQNIAWNNAFYQAYNKLFKDIPVIGDFDPSPYSPYAHKPIQLKEGETLYLFIKPDDAVKAILMQLIDAVTHTTNTRLHLLFLDMTTDEIQLWANRQQIPVALVANQQVTLSNGNQQYQALQLKNKETPLLLLTQGKASQVVDLGRF